MIYVENATDYYTNKGKTTNTETYALTFICNSHIYYIIQLNGEWKKISREDISPEVKQNETVNQNELIITEKYLSLPTILNLRQSFKKIKKN